jgi:hypothetical protein
MSRPTTRGQPITRNSQISGIPSVLAGVRILVELGALGIPERERPDRQAADDRDVHRGRLLAGGGTQAAGRG